VPKPRSIGDPGSPIFCLRLRIDGRRPCWGACAEDRPGPRRHPSWVFASDGQRPCRSSLTAYERIDAVTCTYSNNVGIQLVSLAVRPPPSFRRRRLREGRAEAYAKAAVCNLQARSLSRVWKRGGWVSVTSTGRRCSCCLLTTQVSIARGGHVTTVPPF